jgi:hypothetical protein
VLIPLVVHRERSRRSRPHQPGPPGEE